MAYTLNGIGTTFYGRRDFRTDGTYITTEWLVFFYLPLIPIRSLRVSCLGPSDHLSHLGLGSSESYEVYEKHFPPNWKQVLCTYGYVVLLIAWIYAVISITISIFPHALDTVFNVTMLCFSCIIPVPVPWILRHLSLKRVYEKNDA